MLKQNVQVIGVVGLSSPVYDGLAPVLGSSDISLIREQGGEGMLAPVEHCPMKQGDSLVTTRIGVGTGRNKLANQGTVIVGNCIREPGVAGIGED
jgi:hypothetical protein